LNRYLKAIHPNKSQKESFTPDIEINPTHPLIIKLDELRKTNSELGTKLADYILDSALITGGLMDNPKSAIEKAHSLFVDILAK
jgi:HSP90 family molecular chaperone